ncbi:hypothetical protein [Halorarius litoreus]|uniref:hypothetical protein n=1 Tax=Halorarius litoreus TaxID=2962676 RepID=UPI0020CB8E80|nr:hypothetical protein [Halorarius litoreus]
MSDALQRTVRRCTALLLLPLCLLVVQLRMFMWETHYETLPVVALAVPVVLGGGSLLYLAREFLVSGAGGPDPVDD